MTKARAIRLWGPITFGSALIGVSLLQRDSQAPADRRWNEDAEPSLSADQRELAALPSGLTQLPAAPEHFAPIDVERQNRDQLQAVTKPEPISQRARSQASASNIVLASRIVEQIEAPTLILPESAHTPPAATPEPAPEPSTLAAPVTVDLTTAVPAEASLAEAMIAEDGQNAGIVFVSIPVVQPLIGQTIKPAQGRLAQGRLTMPIADLASEEPITLFSDENVDAYLAQSLPENGPRSGPKSGWESPAEMAAVTGEETALAAPILREEPASAAPPFIAAPSLEAEADPNLILPSQSEADVAGAILPEVALTEAQLPEPQLAETVGAQIGRAQSGHVEQTSAAQPPEAMPEIAPYMSDIPAIVDQALASLSPILPASAVDAAPALTPLLPPALAGAAGTQPQPDDPSLSANQQNFDIRPGRQTFPANDEGVTLSYDDELILQIKVRGVQATDTIIAYGTRDGVYLPFGELSRILDLAIRVSDDGHYASGWFLSEDRTLIVDLRQNLLTTPDGIQEIGPGTAQAFEGELYLRADAFAALLPLTAEPDLRSQSVLLTTLEPFPFEERLLREQSRAGLASRGARSGREEWPREETPWLGLSVPMADVELRGVSDSGFGTRGEFDLRLAGDVAFMTGQAFFSATTRDGLVASLVGLGRRDADGDLLGPLAATEFQLGDIATTSMPLGLRGTSGRGLFVTNQPFESVSVFDQIDLRGVLPDGYEVELYRNDILLDSTREAINGQYEFLQVPVDYGLNVFRLVFYGPQGQRREEVRRISVGDGRLSQGELQYSFGAVQRGVNLLGVEGPNFRPTDRYGNWQMSGEIAYGITPGLTALASAALFEDAGRQRWITSAGLRTGLGGFALRADAGISDGGGYAAGVGVGGKALGGAFTLSHFEYGGGFTDEVRSIGSEPLSRATEFDFNTSLKIGGQFDGTYLPITARARRSEFLNGRTQTNAALRGSVRTQGMIFSNTLEYSGSTSPGGTSFSQLVGFFDLATFNRSSTQFRTSFGYSIAPEISITQVSGEIDHALDDQTVVRGSAAYSFNSNDVGLGLSAIREFDRFTVALDGQYTFGQNTYSAALRVGFSFGRDPLRRRFFVDQTGLASSGAIALRAFQDMDGDLIFSPGDTPLPEVDFAVFNNTATTDAGGFARIGELGNGNRVSVQVDPSSLPDILMAPVQRGIEIIPRAGRVHVTQFPIVALSEVEGTVTFADSDSDRGVSGLRLQLIDNAGEVQNVVRTERGGYYFFEQVMPGAYQLIIDPEQAERFGICLVAPQAVQVGQTGDIYSVDVQARQCDEAPQPEVP